MRMEARRMAEAEDVPRVGRHVDLLTNKAFSWKWLGSNLEFHDHRMGVALPRMSDAWIGPKLIESRLSGRLSPSTKYCPWPRV